MEASDVVADLQAGPREPRSTVPSAEDEAVIVAFRRHVHLPLDDCLYALQAMRKAMLALAALFRMRAKRPSEGDEIAEATFHRLRREATSDLHTAGTPTLPPKNTVAPLRTKPGTFGVSSPYPLE